MIRLITLRAEGPNGSGKSTLLSVITDLLKYEGYAVIEEGALNDDHTILVGWADNGRPK